MNQSLRLLVQAIGLGLIWGAGCTAKTQPEPRSQPCAYFTPADSNALPSMGQPMELVFSRMAGGAR